MRGRSPRRPPHRGSGRTPSSGPAQRRASARDPFAPPLPGGLPLLLAGSSRGAGARVLDLSIRTSCSPSCRCSVVGLGSCLTVDSRTGFSNAYLLSRKHSGGHFVELLVAERPRRSRWPADEEGLGFFGEGHLDHTAWMPASDQPQRLPDVLGLNPRPAAGCAASDLHRVLHPSLPFHRPFSLSSFTPELARSIEAGEGGCDFPCLGHVPGKKKDGPFGPYGSERRDERAHFSEP